MAPKYSSCTAGRNPGSWCCCLPANAQPLPPAFPPQTVPAAYANRLATGREPVLTGSVVGVLYVVGRLAGAVSIVGLAYSAVLGAFTAPKVGARPGLAPKQAELGCRPLSAWRRRTQASAEAGMLPLPGVLRQLCPMAAAQRGARCSSSFPCSLTSVGKQQQAGPGRARPRRPLLLNPNRAAAASPAPPPPCQVYELKKAEIDALVDKARAQWTAVYDKHLHKVGRGLQQQPGRRPR